MASLHLFVRLILISLLAGNNNLVRCNMGTFHGHQIKTMPGYHGVLPSQHYAGYVKIHGKPGVAEEKKLFYYFVESESNATIDPLVLWLNGGPGCSSLGGFVYEHGPFKFESSSESGSSLPRLSLNPYSWSKVSNILYLDSPCGTGLSYSKNTSNYFTGDIQTASDSHAFLLKWFNLYPQFLPNPFYISGESYGGIYVPTLAANVVKGIKSDAKPLINFKMKSSMAINARAPYAHGMGLISADIFEDMQKTCKGNYTQPSPSLKCRESIQKGFEAVGDINWYNILEPCYKYPSNSSNLHVPCFNDDLARAWLNDENVRKAIHASQANITGAWEICTERVNYTMGIHSVIQYHINLTTQGYRALIYSGDHDLAVTFIGTYAWTRSLEYKIIKPWRCWLSNTNQIAGYLQRYENNLTFLTIKGAGHMVPYYKPMEALTFYSRWLRGEAI